MLASFCGFHLKKYMKIFCNFNFCRFQMLYNCKMHKNKDMRQRNVSKWNQILQSYYYHSERRCQNKMTDESQFGWLMVTSLCLISFDVFDQQLSLFETLSWWWKINLFKAAKYLNKLTGIIWGKANVKHYSNCLKLPDGYTCKKSYVKYSAI